MCGPGRANLSAPLRAGQHRSFQDKIQHFTYWQDQARLIILHLQKPGQSPAGEILSLAPEGEKEAFIWTRRFEVIGPRSS